MNAQYLCETFKLNKREKNNNSIGEAVRLKIDSPTL